jgi:hypothetical protein
MTILSLVFLPYGKKMNKKKRKSENTWIRIRKWEECSFGLLSHDNANGIHGLGTQIQTIEPFYRLKSYLENLK